MSKYLLDKSDQRKGLLGRQGIKGSKMSNRGVKGPATGTTVTQSGAQPSVLVKASLVKSRGSKLQGHVTSAYLVMVLQP